MRALDEKLLMQSKLATYFSHSNQRMAELYTKIKS